jgi:hypothetical protein
LEAVSYGQRRRDLRGGNDRGMRQLCYFYDG